MWDNGNLNSSPGRANQGAEARWLWRNSWDDGKLASEEAKVGLGLCKNPAEEKQDVKNNADS